MARTGSGSGKKKRASGQKKSELVAGIGRFFRQNEEERPGRGALKMALRREMEGAPPSASHTSAAPRPLAKVKGGALDSAGAGPKPGKTS